MIRSGNNQSNIAQDYGLSESAYSCGYDLRLKHASFMHETLSWVSRHYSELLSDDNTKILSLGCGSGLFDSDLIEIIQRYNAHWSFKGLDFSVIDLDHFRKKISTLDSETQDNITLEYRKFSSSTDMAEQYNLITMIHFLHSFDDVMPIIKNALRHLSPGGKLLIVQQKKQGVAELKNKFLDVLSNQKFQSSDQIKTLLKNENITFTSHSINTHFDISIMQQMSLDTLLLMSFCFCNDLSVLNTQQQEKIRKAFLFLAREEEGGSQIINEQMDVIVCQA